MFNHENLVFLLFVEGSSQEYREKKEKESEQESPASDSDSDDDADECGATSEQTQPMTEKAKIHMEYTLQFLKQKFGISSAEDESGKILKTVDFQGLADHWNEHGFKNIITMVGAGISTCKLEQFWAFLDCLLCINAKKIFC